jgi:NAD+ kinase
MKLGIFYREDNEQSVKNIKKFKQLLLCEKLEFVDLEESICDDESLEGVTLIVVFGGDGCVLSAAKHALDRIPLVAINTGTVGFLSSFEKEDLETIISAIKNQTLEFTERRLLAAEIDGKCYFALNDAVIMKDFKNDNYSCCIKLNLTIDGKKVDKYLADGLILSTATGSTAYALSAGAPILTPDLEAVVVAPICPHSLESRPIVFAPKSVAEVTIDDSSRDCALYLDGKLERTLSKNEKIKIFLSKKSIKICDNCNNFFEKLSKKISSWSNTNREE